MHIAIKSVALPVAAGAAFLGLVLGAEASTLPAFTSTPACTPGAVIAAHADYTTKAEEDWLASHHADYLGSRSGLWVDGTTGEPIGWAAVEDDPIRSCNG